jgi:hypothetical protein
MDKVNIKVILLYKGNVLIEKNITHSYKKDSFDILIEMVNKHFKIDIMKYSITEIFIKENVFCIRLRDEDFVKIRNNKINEILS